MLPRDSGEAGERSETEGGAMQSIALKGMADNRLLNLILLRVLC